MKYSAQYHVFPSTFHVLSRKIDFLWDIVYSFLDSLELSSRLQVNIILSNQGFKGKCLLYNRFYCRHSQFVRKHVQQIAVQSCVHFLRRTSPTRLCILRIQLPPSFQPQKANCFIHNFAENSLYNVHFKFSFLSFETVPNNYAKSWQFHLA